MIKYRIIATLCILSFTSLFAQGQEKRAYLVSNAHFDTQWNWDVQASIGEFLPNTLHHNIYLFGKYPDYIFNFEGGIKYAWMKEYYPKQYELVKKYIKDGRWNVVGSSWDANDTNIPSPESALRNILYAQQLYKQEFGIQATDVFLPDCFGFSWTLPTIANHAGLIGFSTQKLQWRTNAFYPTGKVPFDIGFWKGVDGSSILSVLNGQAYDTKWEDEDLSHNSKLLGLAQNNPLGWAFHYYGVGDAGGAPTASSVSAVSKGMKGNGSVKIIGAKSDQLYKDYYNSASKPSLPLFNGELLMDVHGTAGYTSQAAMKLYNRKNELLADAAERAAVVSDWIGGGYKYPKEKLTEAWKRVLWHQNHDDLPGTSIPEAYVFSWNDELLSMKEFANILTASVGNASRTLDTQVTGIPLVIFNPVSTQVSDVIIASIKMETEGSVSVYNEDGTEVPSQVLSVENGIVKIAISASVPSCGYAVYDVRAVASNQSFSAISVTNNIIENSVYKVTLDGNGDIQSIKDKRYGKELVESGKSIRLALFSGNKSVDWPAWEIKKSVIDQTPVSVTTDVKITPCKTGTARGGLCVERTYGSSTFKQYIYLYEGGQADRIDIYNEFDWQTKNTLLKAEFPLNVSNSKATYDLGIGAIERGNNTTTAYEVCAQYWADLTDASQNYGVSVLNDSRYGWDKPNDNTLRLTLLHSPEVGDPYKYQADQDLGFHTFKYSIVGHNGSYRDASTVLKAEIMNQPMKAFVVNKSSGNQGKTLSFVSLDNDKVIVKALKQAEESDEYVIRLHETSGNQNQSVKLSFIQNIQHAKELNGVEKEIGGIIFSGKELTVELTPFSIKTLKVKLNDAPNSHSPIISNPVALAYDSKVTTFDGAYAEADVDGKGGSYSAELWKESLEWNGVTFDLGTAHEKNAMKAAGKEIQLPANHNYNKLYLLAASTNQDQDVSISIDGKSEIVNIPHYSGLIGQWGHTGQTEGFLKDADVAYVGTHKHTSNTNGKFNEVADNIKDKSTKTKYTVVGKKEFWLDCYLESAEKVESYSLSVPQNLSERNPKNWTLSGWDAANNKWVELDKRSSVEFPSGASTLMFDIASPITTSQYLLEVTDNNGGSDSHLLQWQLFGNKIGASISMSERESPIRVYDKESKIVIESENQEDFSVEVYSILGAKISEVASNGRSTVEIDVVQGLYIVRVDGTTTKVLVK